MSLRDRVTIHHAIQRALLARQQRKRAAPQTVDDLKVGDILVATDKADGKEHRFVVTRGHGE